MDNPGKIVIVSLLLFFLASGITFGQWSVELSPATRVENKLGYPLFKWYPDGHISVIPDDGGYIMFWAEFESHRSVGPSQFVEEQKQLSPGNAVFGGRGNFDSWDNGGSWLMSVFRENGDNFVGFYHAEDHWYPHTTNDIAWKSLGVTYSSDEGKTWSAGSQIITSPATKPNTPTWGGSGDCCVVWDHINNRWMCYYQEHNLLMAVSTDPKGAPGTWKKYYNGAFTEDGLGGQHTKVPGLTPGGNPSVHWNTYLKKWVMVWHGWSPPNIYLSVSEDGINWEEPKSIIVSSISGRAWYPTIIGNTDVEAGQIAKIYYADIAGDFSFRNFETRTITFFDAGNLEPATAKIDAPVDGITLNDNSFTIKTSAYNLKANVKEVQFYVNDLLVGSDYTFPYELEWTADKKGEHQIQSSFIDNNNTVIASNIIKINLDFNVGINAPSRDSELAWLTSIDENQITVTIPGGKKHVSIYNLSSNIVYCKDIFEEQFEIDISYLKPGVYILVVNSGHNSRRMKFIKGF